jgi:hypothetical protein
VTPPTASAPLRSTPPPTLCFARAARTLTDVARAAGLVPPAFRCPPRVAGALRTVRRMPGGVVVAVQLRDRPFDRVAADMVEGILVANHLEGEAALRMRAALCRALVEPSGMRSGSGVGGAGEAAEENVVIDLTVAEPAAAVPGPTDAVTTPAVAPQLSVRSAA